MLSTGTRVKITNDARDDFTNIPNPHRGEITYVVGQPSAEDDEEWTYFGESIMNLELYEVACTDVYLYKREELQVLDDDPCDEEFLEEFKELINETVVSR